MLPWLNSVWIGNGECTTSCNTTACNFDGGDCSNITAACYSTGCNTIAFGDGLCDTQCNNTACGFDGGDC